MPPIPSSICPAISLAIWGNPTANGGFREICSLNNPPFDSISHMSYGGLRDNAFYFIVCTTRTYTQYTLVHNHIRSFDGSREAALKIAIAIPQGFRPAGGHTPLDVLLRLRRYVVDNCMTPIPGVPDGYGFKADVDCRDACNSILQDFPLEAHVQPVRPMRGSDAALMLIPRAKWADFFRDVNYPELQNYLEVIVAEHGVPVPSANPTLIPNVVTGPHVDVPRRPAYTLVVNGQPMPWPCANFRTDTVVVTLPGIDLRCYDFRPLTFRLADAERGGVPGVRVNAVEERVECTIAVTPRRREFSIVVNGLEGQQVKRFLNSLRLTNGGRTLQVIGNEFTLTGEELLRPTHAEWDTRHFVKTAEPKYDGHRYLLFVRAVMSESPRRDGPTADVPLPGGRSLVIVVPRAYRVDDDKLPVSLSFCGQSLEGRYHISGLSMPDGSTSRGVVISLPHNWSGGLGYRVGSDTNKAGYWSGSARIEPQGATTIGLMEGNLLKKGFSPFRQKAFMFVCIFLVGLVIGGAGGWLAGRSGTNTASADSATITSGTSSDRNNTEIGDGGGTVGRQVTPLTPEQCRDVLDDDNLTFADVLSMDVDGIGDDNLREKVLGYQSFVNAVHNRDYEEAKFDAESLNPVHRTLFAHFCSWLGEAKAKRVFEQNTWEGFDDIQAALDANEEEKNNHARDVVPAPSVERRPVAPTTRESRPVHNAGNRDAKKGTRAGSKRHTGDKAVTITDKVR